MIDHLCSHCGQPHILQNAHKESLTKIKCNMLKAAAAHVIVTRVNNFKNKDIADGHSGYGNFQKLRYHGLITQVKTNGIKSRDHWLITRNGWAFLRGEIDLPKFVLVKDNHILVDGHSNVRVGLLDVLKGGDYMETTFEYFDEETGALIGRRPATPHIPEQRPLFDLPTIGRSSSSAIH